MCVDEKERPSHTRMSRFEFFIDRLMLNNIPGAGEAVAIVPTSPKGRDAKPQIDSRVTVNLRVDVS